MWICLTWMQKNTPNKQKHNHTKCMANVSRLVYKHFRIHELNVLFDIAMGKCAKGKYWQSAVVCHHSTISLRVPLPRDGLSAFLKSRLRSQQIKLPSGKKYTKANTIRKLKCFVQKHYVTVVFKSWDIHFGESSHSQDGNNMSNFTLSQRGVTSRYTSHLLMLLLSPLINMLKTVNDCSPASWENHSILW